MVQAMKTKGSFMYSGRTFSHSHEVRSEREYRLCAPDLAAYNGFADEGGCVWLGAKLLKRNASRIEEHLCVGCVLCQVERGANKIKKGWDDQLKKILVREY